MIGVCIGTPSSPCAHAHRATIAACTYVDIMEGALMNLPGDTNTSVTLLDNRVHGFVWCTNKVLSLVTSHSSLLACLLSLFSPVSCLLSLLFSLFSLLSSLLSLLSLVSCLLSLVSCLLRLLCGCAHMRIATCKHEHTSPLFCGCLWLPVVAPTPHPAHEDEAAAPVTKAHSDGCCDGT